MPTDATFPTEAVPASSAQKKKRKQAATATETPPTSAKRDNKRKDLADPASESDAQAPSSGKRRKRPAAAAADSSDAGPAADATVKVSKGRKKRKQDADEASTPRKRVKKKAPRAKSAYSFFAATFQPTPDATFGERSKQCSLAWKGITDKSVYEEQAAADRARIAADAPPKKPVSAYVRFSVSERARLKAAEPELTFKELSQRCGLAWRGLDDGARAEWNTAGTTP